MRLHSLWAALAGLLLYASAAGAQQVNGFNVQQVDYPGGAFRQDRGGWTQTDVSTAAINQYREDGRDEWSVYLTDDRRGLRAQLDLHRRLIQIFNSANGAVIWSQSITGASVGQHMTTPVSPAGCVSLAFQFDPTRETQLQGCSNGAGFLVDGLCVCAADVESACYPSGLIRTGGNEHAVCAPAEPAPPPPGVVPSCTPIAGSLPRGVYVYQACGQGTGYGMRNNDCACAESVRQACEAGGGAFMTRNNGAEAACI